MTLGQAEKLYMDWLVERTGDEGFRHRDVLNVLYYARLRKRRKPKWKQILNAHLTVGMEFAEELITDYIELSVMKVAIKYA